MDDFKRLEEVVAALVDRHRLAQDEIRRLRKLLSERDRELSARDSEILELSQKQEDVAKRLDEMIEQLDELDASLASAPAAE